MAGARSIIDVHTTSAKLNHDSTKPFGRDDVTNITGGATINNMYMNISVDEYPVGNLSITHPPNFHSPRWCIVGPKTGVFAKKTR